MHTHLRSLARLSPHPPIRPAAPARRLATWFCIACTLLLLLAPGGRATARAQAEETRSADWRPSLAENGLSAVYHGDFPFMAAGVLWSGESEPLELRVRADGESWREWEPIEADDFQSAADEAASG